MSYTGAPSLPYSKLGIVEDGDTASRAISKDAYVIWKGNNYFAKTDILQGATFVVDTNLTAIPDGVINWLKDLKHHEIIWQNANPGSAMSAPTTLVNTTDYSLVAVAFANSTSIYDRGVQHTQFMQKGSGCFCTDGTNYRQIDFDSTTGDIKCTSIIGSSSYWIPLFIVGLR